jgi:hypothetical protein
MKPSASGAGNLASSTLTSSGGDAPDLASRGSRRPCPRYLGPTSAGQARRQDALAVKEDHYHRVERARGTFQRSFVLPTLVEQDKVQATYTDGVLELRLPKSEAAKSKRIAITS